MYLNEFSIQIVLVFKHRFGHNRNPRAALVRRRIHDPSRLSEEWTTVAASTRAGRELSPKSYSHGDSSVHSMVLDRRRWREARTFFTEGAQELGLVGPAAADRLGQEGGHDEVGEGESRQRSVRPGRRASTPVDALTAEDPRSILCFRVRGWFVPRPKRGRTAVATPGFGRLESSDLIASGGLTDRERRSAGRRRINDDLGIADAGNIGRLLLRLGWVGLAYRALRVDIPSGIHRLVTDRATDPGRGGLGRRVIVPRIHWRDTLLVK
jgi:hypothetical protein